jgi:hypothetical protein
MAAPLHSITLGPRQKQLRLLVARGEHGSLPRDLQQVASTPTGREQGIAGNRDVVVLVSIEVAKLFARKQMSCILPPALASRSKPCELVTRKGAPIPAAANC